ncbi:MAG TPA: polysaccharide biosynthesis tyrosine autokinase [Candidatus Dormibacteraeota bacterium]|nr:polysaccharide biosynthesis tyrosine autokinase [Candidatus Dormibacteraeota bacterium]
MDDLTKIIPGDNGANGNQVSLPFRGRPLSWEVSPQEPHLYDYLLTLRKHQWVILSFALTVVTIAAIATFRMKPVYSTTARIEIDRENTSVLPFPGDPYQLAMDMDNYIETQSKILTSETLALQTIRTTVLATHPNYAAGGAPSEAIAAGSLANQKRPPELSAFLNSLTVKRVPNSRLLDVSFEETDPQLAAQILNKHLDNFIEQNYRGRYEAMTQASRWLADQLDELKIKVQHSEDARIAYERKNQIWAVDDKQNVTTQRFADLNKDLSEAQSDRMKKEALVQYAKSGNMDAVPQLQNDTNLTDLSKKRTEVSTQYTEAVNQYGPNFPKVLRLQEDLKGIDQLIETEKKNVVDRMESDFRAAKHLEELRMQAMESQKNEVNAMSEKMVEYNILKREAEANKALYEGLLTKLKEAGISEGLKSSNIRTVDPAMIPSFPVRPAKARNIGLALLIGLVGGVGLALMLEYFDNTVKTPDHIEALIKLPALAVVPAFRGEDTGRFSGLFRGTTSNGSDKRIERVELVAQHLPKSQMSEAFRALRTSLLLSQAGHPPQVILVTSALPREGKTTTAANLAVTLAQLGDSTLLIDADLRKPGVARMLNMTSGKYAGLSSYLAGVSSLELVIVPHPSIPNFAAIPAGPLPPNPADLLSSRRMIDAINELRSKYKFIVIDSPPVLAATDAVILSVQTDGVLLVVRSGETPKLAFARTRDLLSTVKCHLLGVVLNAVDTRGPDYYYSYRYYPYSYGYGQEESLENGHEAFHDKSHASYSGKDDSETL